MPRITGIRPQCGPLGYESEHYCIVSIHEPETGMHYEFFNCWFVRRMVDAQASTIEVYSNMDDLDLVDPDGAELVGTIDVNEPEAINEALAEFLVRCPDVLCDIW